MYAYCIGFVNDNLRSPPLKIAFFNELGTAGKLA
jgi:hypothetical protein